MQLVWGAKIYLINHEPKLISPRFDKSQSSTEAHSKSGPEVLEGKKSFLNASIIFSDRG